MLEINPSDPKLIQGTPEWLALRKNKITGTDAAIIMGSNPWKSKKQLYHEKISLDHQSISNERMQRGVDLEPIARDLFSLEMGIVFYPYVGVHDWAMASLDGINELGTMAVEIKCPGAKTHQLALNGLVPDYYYPQLQHQMWVCDLHYIYYYSFDGRNGVKIRVERDEFYIQEMIAEEYKFYLCLLNKTEPE